MYQQITVQPGLAPLPLRRLARRLDRRLRPRLTLAGGSASARFDTALAIAAAQRRDLLAIDLGQLVSRYAGDTERQLRLVLAEAGRRGALLFFDEADALFGKRGRVRDSHDRYANLEVSYLLGRLAWHRGPVLLGKANPDAPAAPVCR